MHSPFHILGIVAWSKQVNLTLPTETGNLTVRACTRMFAVRRRDEMILFNLLFYLFFTYLGYEIIRDREAKTAKIVQSGYVERVLKTFGKRDCHPVKTPLDANNRHVPSR